MQPSPSITPLSGFGLPRVRAVALAYRAAMGEGHLDGPAYQRAVAAYLSFGDTPDDAMREIPRMIAAVAAQHEEWFWRLASERSAREKAALQALGWWPGPVAHDARRELVARAIAPRGRAAAPAAWPLTKAGLPRPARPVAAAGPAISEAGWAPGTAA